MSRDTIETLSWLTSEVRSIFYHPTLAPRIAQMLNYFLKFLVGPSSKEFKVKDMKEYHFEPANIVHDICLIYVHLCSKQDSLLDAAASTCARAGSTFLTAHQLGVDHDFEDESKIHSDFCKVIASDQRSYSVGLLAEAGRVLLKTGMSENGLGLKMASLSAFIDKLGAETSAAEINVDDVPDEFLDPVSYLDTVPFEGLSLNFWGFSSNFQGFSLNFWGFSLNLLRIESSFQIMSTLMTDPVKLPSGYILDRSTIARHLLR